MCSDSNGMASVRGIRLLLGLPVHPELGRERIKRPLRRIALDLPHPFLLKELGVVAEHRHAAEQPEHRVPLVRRLPVLLDLALGCVAVAGDLVLRFGGGSRYDHHLHQSQGTGLVRADPRHRAQGFYGREAPDNRVALRHTLDADRQGNRDQRGQAFRNQRHRDADDRLEQLHELHTHHPAAVGEHQNPHDADGGGDQVAEVLDLPQERRLERADAGEQLVDAAELSLAPGGDHHPGRAARHDHGPGKGHAVAVADGGLLGDRIGSLLGRDRLAGERRLLGAQVLCVGEAEIGRHLVAGFEQHDVPRHQLVSRDHARLAAARRPGLGREHVANRVERLLGLAFLDEAEQRVEKHDPEDDPRIEPQAEHQLHEGGAEQHVDEDIVELGKEAYERPALLAFRQAVGTVLLQTGRCFACVETFVGAGSETL